MTGVPDSSAGRTAGTGKSGGKVSGSNPLPGTDKADNNGISR